MDMLSIDEFEVDRQVFEARFPLSFLLWDRSGEMWSLISRDFEDLKMVNASPINIQFESERFYLVAEPNLLRITSKDNTAYEEFEKKAQAFFRLIVKFLEIQTFTRLGLRTIWTKRFPAMIDARSALAGLKLVTAPDPKSLGFKDDLPGVDLKFTWDDAHHGVTLGIRSERRKAEPQIPWEVRTQIEFKAPEKYFLVVDADYYTVPQLRAGQVEVQEWLSSSHRVIKKALTKEVFA
jgi:hypothetical protein